MKKWIAVITVCLLAGMLLPGAAGAEDRILPTINEVLGGAELPEGMIEVSDRLDAYDPLGSESIGENSIEWKIVILQRQKPLKELTEEVLLPPFADDIGYPIEYAGTDMGGERVWVRCDMMRQLPAELRANSMEEAGVVIMAENIYMCSGTLTVTHYANGVNRGEVPAFETTEELEAYLNEHQPEVESINRYPKFATFMLTTMYDAKTKNCDIISSQFLDASIQAKNPAASDQADHMDAVLRILLALAGEEPDLETAKALIGDAAFLAEETRAKWTETAENGETENLFMSVYETYWLMAAELREMDPSEENRKAYDLAIEAQNISLLRMLIEQCNYGSFAESIDEVRDTLIYIAMPDQEWYDAGLQEVVDALLQIL